MREIDEIKQIIQLDRENAALYLKLAGAAERYGGTAEAVKALKRAWILAGSDETVESELARLLRWDERKDECDKILDEFCDVSSSALSATSAIARLAEKLVEISHPDTIDKLIECGTSPERPAWYAREAVIAVGRFRIPPAVDGLIEIEKNELAPPDLLLEAMAETGSPETLDRLTAAIDGPLTSRKTEALFAGIGRVATRDARQFLLDRFRKNRPTEVAPIVAALAFCPSQSDMPVALRHVESESDHERAAAVKLLAAINLPDAQPVVIGRLDDKAAEVVEAAAVAVKELQIVGALPRLRRVTDYWNEAARIAVLEALGAVGTERDIRMLESFADKTGYGAAAGAARGAAREIRIRKTKPFG
jgi:HEAT repeat protein